MKQKLLEKLQTLVKLPYINKTDFDMFKTFLLNSETYTRSENPEFHVCAFFMPVHLPSKNIYFGHHIKANDWIPTGGHVDLNESSRQAIEREIVEELGHKITNEKVELVDISIRNIDNPNQKCKRHHSFWYIVHFDEKKDFNFDRREFYEAGWYTEKNVMEKTKSPVYKKVMLNYFERLK